MRLSEEAHALGDAHVNLPGLVLLLERLTLALGALFAPRPSTTRTQPDLTFGAPFHTNVTGVGLLPTD